LKVEEEMLDVMLATLLGLPGNCAPVDAATLRRASHSNLDGAIL